MSDGPSLSIQGSVDPGSASPAAVQAQYVLRKNYVYDLPFADAGIVLNRARSTWAFPSANYGAGAGNSSTLNPRMSIRIDSNRAMVVSTLKMRVRLQTRHYPGTSGSTLGTVNPAYLAYAAGRSAIADSVMRLDCIADCFEEIAIRHLSGQDICRVRDAALCAKMLRICNEQRPPPRWSLVARPARGGYSGMTLPIATTYAASADFPQVASNVVSTAGEHRHPTLLRAIPVCIDEAPDDVYNGLNMLCDEDLQRSFYFSASAVVPGDAQEQTGPQKGRLMTFELPVPCFRNAPVWPGLMGGMIIDIQLRDSTKAFKPTLPRMDPTLGNAPYDYTLAPSYTVPSASGVAQGYAGILPAATPGSAWEYQFCDPEIVMDTLQLSATFEQAVQTAAQGSGLPLYWTQPRISRVAVPQSASEILARVESAASNVIGVMVATYSETQYNQAREHLVFGNPWNEFSIRLGTSVIPNGRPWSGSDQSYQNMRSWFPLLPGFPGGIRRCDWEGTNELIIHANYRSTDSVAADVVAVIGTSGGSGGNAATHVPGIMAHVSLYNPNKHLWVWDARTTPGVPLTGVSTTNSQMTLVFKRTVVALPTTLTVYLGGSSDNQTAVSTQTLVPSLGITASVPTPWTQSSAGALTMDNFTMNSGSMLLNDGVHRQSAGNPCVVLPKGAEALQGFRNMMGDFNYPIFVGANHATAATAAANALTAYQTEGDRLWLPLIALSGSAGAVTDAANTVKITLSSGALKQYDGTTDYVSTKRLPIYAPVINDLTLLILTLNTVLVLVSPQGVTVRE